MNNIITKSKLDDKYFKKYNLLFNYSVFKFDYINKNLLFNFIFTDNNTLCNKYILNFDYNTYYSNIFLQTSHL